MSDQTKTAPMVLVDGSSYLYRAFHAIPPLTTSDGQPTNAARGVISMIRSLIGKYPESPIVVIFDAKGKTFRDEIYSEYKAQRPPMPDDLRLQIEPIHRMIEAMGLPLVIIEGVEADDVIGTIAKQVGEAGRDVIVSTGDKDMAQLVTDKVTLVNTMTDTVMDIAGVKDKFGIPPELIIDYLALMGDKVDNIPGVPGVGEKTALALLQGIGSIKDIYERLDDIAPLGFRGSKTMSKKMEDNRDMAELSYTLATIKCDVELPFDMHALKNEPANKEVLREWFQKLEFKTWLRDIDKAPMAAGTTVNDSDEGEDTPAVSDIEVQYETVLDKSQFNQWLEQLNQAELVAFDTETTSLNYMQAELVGVSVAIEAGKAAYIPVAHDYEDAPEQLDRDWVLEQLKPWLEDEGKAKVGQHLKYDANVLNNYDITLRGIKFDTMLESYVFNSTGTRHDMDSLSSKFLGHSTVKFEDIAGKGAKQKTFNQIDLEQAAFYAAEDADITLRLHQAILPKLEKTPELVSVFSDIELPLVPVLAKMEQTGALIDPDRLHAQSAEIASRLQEVEIKAHEEAGQEFNLSSPKQLQEILFEKQGLPVIKKTPKGQPSTAEPILQELAENYELPRLIMEHRSLAKLKSTYTDKLPEMIQHTGRIHTSYHQAVTATGRLSSTDPNLQNIPIRTQEGRRIRQAFVAPEGHKLVAADYSQIELRIMAHLSQDKGLLDAFAHDEDVHKATAAEVFEVAVDDVTAEQRRRAKAINFGLIYGMSAFGLAKQLGISRPEAQKYVQRYFERYPGVRTYMETTRENAKEKGYVETIFGRRLYLPEIKARNAMMRQAAERTAINAPMQGSAADIIKRAMIKMHNWLADTDLGVKMIMQVHDELIFEVAEKDLEAAQAKIIDIMQNSTEIDVPLLVEAGVGDNWDEAH
ncbi:DNA polymerase I [Marinomonas mediterranea]|jgi:DNA polymerase I (EC 2.7.7.7)|uniref:DNA polymerase I n=1 Tax=Marinomonas mediterranea (strain ATCC 700492 / JCM 21426 / NBRC 103028 / MMB-1) TaxID=717774 RepID=F2JWB8_MARM1|nr:DNA polymerase I [Marinomonas mediterranea]ADZ89506.1 DNA polymerase I [Marinomonas mediterranea MMB-1]